MEMWFPNMKHSFRCHTSATCHPKVSMGTQGVLNIYAISVFQSLVESPLICPISLCLPRNKEIQHTAFSYNFLLPVTSLGVSPCVSSHGVAHFPPETVSNKLAFQWWLSIYQLDFFCISNFLLIPFTMK